ncbi:P-loop containing nucleoside triphosphate hydrolase protein [Rhizophagus diaphanus]|nr:P-loop containing nucleoside triphosphate hydrolase protein [Rhizophagus diaphanus] [Rhizophagus sp. MUCL 43196]
MFIFNLTKSFKCITTSGSYILNILHNGSIAHYNTDSFFFNRKREIANFKNAFNTKRPDLHIIVGPPSTGKTTLIKQVVQSSKYLFNPIFINLRNGQFDTPQRVYDSIYSQFNPFFNKYKSLLKNIFGEKFSLEYTDFNLLYRFNNKYREKTSDDVRILLEKISNYLPNWDFWHNYQIPSPILIIDEAHLLNQLGYKDKSLLKLILNWFVLNSKERERFHIVLTSSDSFFFTWLAEVLNIPHVKPYIIGDLTNQEAEEYFEKYALPQYECKELSGKFNQIRKITGTRILIINKYINEYKIYRNDEMKFKINRFSVYESEYRKLNYGLYPNRYNFRFLDKLNPPFWKDVDLIKVMNAIVKAENQGYIIEDDLIKEIGAEKVYSFIDYNFLHRRLTTRFTYDIIDPPNKIILTAMNQPSVCAMKQVLSEIAEEKKKEKK